MQHLIALFIGCLSIIYSAMCLILVGAMDGSIFTMFAMFGMMYVLGVLNIGIVGSYANKTKGKKK